MRPATDNVSGIPRETGAATRLFRAEALTERHTQWLGTVLLARRPSLALFAAFAALAVAAIAALLLFAQIAPKVRMGGWLVPQSGELQAHLYAPGATLGFLSVGQAVRLRYDAYPQHKSGDEATIAAISRAATGPAELPPQVASHVAPDKAKNAAPPIYRVTVALAPGSAPVPLEAGMLVEADVALGRQRLYEWVLGPLAR